MDAPFDEFLSAFRVYVRLQEDQTMNDDRDAAARKLAALPVMQVVSLMEPHDLAAIVSGVTAVVSPSAVARLKLLDGKRLQSTLMTLTRNGSLPLAVADDHPIGAMLIDMIQGIQGARAYRDIAALLDVARTKHQLRPYLHFAENTPGPYWEKESELSGDRSDETDEDAEASDDEDQENCLGFAAGDD